MSPVKYQTIL
ncbi:hypothetical protein A2U01_0087147, partial [Trifolium medium]|nr:hypothetical protein [Trifolium medium]